jgi:predicted PurR-regulated permease PerM
MGTFSFLTVVAVFFGLALLICWIVLPFAVIGTKDLLRELVAEQKKTNAHLQSLRR